MAGRVKRKTIKRKTMKKKIRKTVKRKTLKKKTRKKAKSKRPSTKALKEQISKLETQLKIAQSKAKPADLSKPESKTKPDIKKDPEDQNGKATELGTLNEDRDAVLKAWERTRKLYGYSQSQLEQTQNQMGALPKGYESQYLSSVGAKSSKQREQEAYEKEYLVRYAKQKEEAAKKDLEAKLKIVELETKLVDLSKPELKPSETARRRWWSSLQTQPKGQPQTIFDKKSRQLEQEEYEKGFLVRYAKQKDQSARARETKIAKLESILAETGGRAAKDEASKRGALPKGF